MAVILRFAREMPRIPALPFLLLAAWLAAGLALPDDAAAADELRNGAVSPLEGTTQTVFTFSVEYAGDPADLPTVVAKIGATEVPLSLASGIPSAGTYAGSATLPAGSWQVQFRADNLRGGNAVLNGPSILVREVTPAPQPTPAPTAPPPTPVPATPVPTVPPTATPTATPTPTAAADETPGGALLPRSRGASPTPTPSPSAAALTAGRMGTGSLVLLFIGGTMAGTGAAILGVVWAARHTAARRVDRVSARPRAMVARRAPVPVTRRRPLSR